MREVWGQGEVGAEGGGLEWVNSLDTRMWSNVQQDEKS